MNPQVLSFCCLLYAAYCGSTKSIKSYTIAFYQTRPLWKLEPVLPAQEMTTVLFSRQVSTGTRHVEFQLVILHVLERRWGQELPGISPHRTVQGIDIL